MISLAHPTLIDLTPPELVRVAAGTGFDAVNFRFVGLDAKTAASSALGDEAMLRETAAALASSGIVVLDVEVIRIEADTRAADFRPLFDAGARLGARYVVAVAMDGDEARVAQRFGELCAEAEPFGLRVVLEFMMRGGIRTLAAAHRAVTAAGPSGGVLVDALHFYRCGAVTADLHGLDPDLFPYMQINDVEHFQRSFASPTPESVVWKKVLPGMGDLRLTELLRALPAGIPISVEVPGPAGLRGRDAERYALRALQTTRAVVDNVVEGRSA